MLIIIYIIIKSSFIEIKFNTVTIATIRNFSIELTIKFHRRSYYVSVEIEAKGAKNSSMLSR